MANDYFFEVFINYQRFGEFYFYEKDNEIYADRDFLRRLGILSEKDLKLDEIKQIDKYRIDKARQKIYLEIKDFFKEKKQKNTNIYKAQIQKKDNIFELKSLDIQSGIFYTRNSREYKDFNYNNILSGRFLKYDVDIYFNKDRQNLSLEYPHFSDEEKIRIFSLGYIPQINSNGIHISNFSPYRIGDFDTESIFVDYPINTRVELYRGDFFIKEFIIDKQPYEIVLNLEYGTNIFTMKAYMPNGQVETKRIEKNISSYFLKPKKFEYKIAFGQEEKKSNTVYDLRFSYGFLKNLTGEFSTMRNSVIKRDTLSTYISFFDNSLFQPYLYKLNNHIFYGGRFNYYNNNFSIFAYKEYQNMNAFISFNKYYSTTLSYVEDITAKKYSIRSYPLNFRGLFGYGWYGYAVPKNSFEKEYKFYGGRLSYSLPKLFNIAVKHEIQNSLTGYGRYDFILNKNISNVAYATLNVNLTRYIDEKTFKITETKFDVNIYRTKYLSLSLSQVYNHRNNSYSVNALLNFSFDFESKKIVNDSLRNKTIVKISPFLDANGNGKKEENEKNLNIGIKVNEQRYIAQNGEPIMLYVDPIKNNVIHVENDIQYNTAYNIIMLEKQKQRNGVVFLDIPFYETEEIEGCIDELSKHEKAILYLDGKKYNEMKLRFNCYYFILPKHLKEKAKVVIE